MVYTPVRRQEVANFIGYHANQLDAPLVCHFGIPAAAQLEHRQRGHKHRFLVGQGESGSPASHFSLREILAAFFGESGFIEETVAFLIHFICVEHLRYRVKYTCARVFCKSGR